MRVVILFMLLNQIISVSNRAGHKNMETTARVYAGLIKPRDNSEHLNYMNQITDLQNQTS